MHDVWISCHMSEQKCKIDKLCILGDPGADSGDEGKSKRAEKYDTKKSKERREELFSLFFTFLRSIYIFPPV